MKPSFNDWESIAKQTLAKKTHPYIKKELLKTINQLNEMEQDHKYFDINKYMDLYIRYLVFIREI